MLSVDIYALYVVAWQRLRSLCGRQLTGESVEILHFETGEVEEQYCALRDNMLGLSNASSLVKSKANLVYVGCDKLWVK